MINMNSMIFRRIFAEDGWQSESGGGLGVSPRKFLKKKRLRSVLRGILVLDTAFKNFKFGSATALSHFVTEFSKCHNMSQNFRQVNFVTECHHVTDNPFSATPI